MFANELRRFKRITAARHCRFRVHFLLDISRWTPNVPPQQSATHIATVSVDDVRMSESSTAHYEYTSIPQAACERLSPNELLVEQSKLCMLDSIHQYDYDRVALLADTLLKVQSGETAIHELLSLVPAVNRSGDDWMGNPVDSFEGELCLDEMLQLWPTEHGLAWLQNRCLSQRFVEQICDDLESQLYISHLNRDYEHTLYVQNQLLLVLQQEAESVCMSAAAQSRLPELLSCLIDEICRLEEWLTVHEQLLLVCCKLLAILSSMTAVREWFTEGFGIHSVLLSLHRIGKALANDTCSKDLHKVASTMFGILRQLGQVGKFKQTLEKLAPMQRGDNAAFLPSILAMYIQETPSGSALLTEVLDTVTKYAEIYARSSDYLSAGTFEQLQELLLSVWPAEVSLACFILGWLLCDFWHHEPALDTKWKSLVETVAQALKHQDDEQTLVKLTHFLVGTCRVHSCVLGHVAGIMGLPAQHCVQLLLGKPNDDIGPADCKLLAKGIRSR